MDGMAFDVDGGDLGIGDGDAFWVCGRVELAANGQASLGGGSWDQLDDHAIADEGNNILGSEHSSRALHVPHRNPVQRAAHGF
jgi:hypothetical protein